MDSPLGAAENDVCIAPVEDDNLRYDRKLTVIFDEEAVRPAASRERREVARMCRTSRFVA
jgi:hypothetical protein